MFLTSMLRTSKKQPESENLCQVAILPFPIGRPIVLWNRASMSNAFRDICIQEYLEQDLYLLVLGSRDVIGHVTS